MNHSKTKGIKNWQIDRSANRGDVFQRQNYWWHYFESHWLMTFFVNTDWWLILYNRIKHPINFGQKLYDKRKSNKWNYY